MTEHPSIEPLSTPSAGALAEFLTTLGNDDRTFIREDVGDSELALRGATRWATQEDGRYFVARLGNKVVGFCGVTGGQGWSSHVAQLRLVVGRDVRRQGLGRNLALTTLLAALDAGYTKVTVEVLAAQEPVVALFRSLGFEAEALLVDHVRDGEGNLHDLIYLAHHRSNIERLVAAIGLTPEGAPL